VIAESRSGLGCRHGGAVLSSKLVGDYLRAADRRFTGRLGEFDADFFPPSIWKANPITAVSILGRIAPARQQPTRVCRPRPPPAAHLNRSAAGEWQPRQG
jgi:hypothetical protein